MLTAVSASAPCRADLAGGTLDIWPLGVLHPGAVTVNLAVPVRVQLEVAAGAADGEVWHTAPNGSRRRLNAADAARDLTAAVVFALLPAGGIAVTVRRQAPLGSGLGGSSAYAVALAAAVAAVAESSLEPDVLVAVCRDLEARLLATPTGCQDHWAAVRGGALALHLAAGGDRVEALPVDPAWIGPRLSVVFTGLVHHSGMVNWEVVRRRLDGDAAAIAGFERIADAARRARTALLAGDAAGVGEAIAADWAARRELAPAVCPPPLAAAVERLSQAGAIAVKACGAGGGGSLAVWHEPGAGERLTEAVREVCPAAVRLAGGCDRVGLRLDQGR